MGDTKYAPSNFINNIHRNFLLYIYSWSQYNSPLSEKLSNNLGLTPFPCCAIAVNAKALYRPILVRYPCLLSTDASHI